MMFLCVRCCASAAVAGGRGVRPAAPSPPTDVPPHCRCRRALSAGSRPPLPPKPAQVPARYGDRNGGYCRVKAEIQPRRGDNTEMATIELV